jgi:phenylalanyl-tRNA synthetase beta chain
VIAPIREPVGSIQKLLASSAGQDLVELEFVRQYTGPPLPDDRKSVSYRLTIGALGRTLSSEDVATIRTRIIDALRVAGYNLRL